jgi:membrane protein
VVNTIIGDNMAFIKRVYHFIVDAKIPTMAGSLAFFVFLNGGSYLFLFVVLSLYLPFDLKLVVENTLRDSIFKDLILYLVNHSKSLNYSVFLVVTSIYSSSSLYYHFMHIGELVSMTPQNHKISKRVKSLILVPIFLFLISIAIIATTLASSIFSISYRIVLIAAIIGIVYVMLYIANKLIFHSDKKIINGILFSLIYFIVFTLIFILYLSYFSNFKVVYGVFSFLIILMFYIYVICIGLLLGIRINSKNLDVFTLFYDKK